LRQVRDVKLQSEALRDANCDREKKTHSLAEQLQGPSRTESLAERFRNRHGLQQMEGMWRFTLQGRIARYAGVDFGERKRRAQIADFDNSVGGKENVAAFDVSASVCDMCCSQNFGQRLGASHVTRHTSHVTRHT
jgi:hypothetical protein